MEFVACLKMEIEGAAVPDDEEAEDDNSMIDRCGSNYHFAFLISIPFFSSGNRYFPVLPAALAPLWCSCTERGEARMARCCSIIR
jgi:hypothetical protein